MNFFARYFAFTAPSSLTTVIERKRLSDTMPGQTGAVTAARLGHTLG